MEPRTEYVSFRLAPPSAGYGQRLNLTADEFRALVRAAKGQTLATFVRWLVQAACGWREGSNEDALALAAARASELGLPLALYVRLIVLEAVGFTDLHADVAKARQVAAS